MPVSKDSTFKFILENLRFLRLCSHYIIMDSFLCRHDKLSSRRIFADVIVYRSRGRIQLLPERLSEKKVNATIPKGNMGYDQYAVPDTVAVEPTFVAFL